MALMDHASWSLGLFSKKKKTGEEKRTTEEDKRMVNFIYFSLPKLPFLDTY